MFNQRELGNLEVQGNVLLNGVPLVGMDRDQRSLFGYVQQHDILPGVLTVREYLYFTVGDTERATNPIPHVSKNSLSYAYF